MLMKYRLGMSPDAVAAFMAEIERLDRCYAEAAEFDAAHEPPAGAEEDCECFDPVRDGWVNRNTGRP